jgi:hypothetical protein
VHCPKLSTIAITNCSSLDTFMLWSEDLTHLDLSGAHTCDLLPAVHPLWPHLLPERRA